jgi:diadenosine tetraphosphate (Ap4A) HIT family hydrolase
MKTLRTELSEKIYQEYRDTKIDGYCPFCERDLFIREWKHWILIENRFPYDRVAEVSDLLALKKHKGEMNDWERKELKKILEEIQGEYHAILMNFTHRQSLPKHLHFHLLKYYGTENNQSSN